MSSVELRIRQSNLLHQSGARTVDEYFGSWGREGFVFDWDFQNGCRGPRGGEKGGDEQESLRSTAEVGAPEVLTSGWEERCRLPVWRKGCCGRTAQRRVKCDPSIEFLEDAQSIREGDIAIKWLSIKLVSESQWNERKASATTRRTRNVTMNEGMRSRRPPLRNSR